MKKNIERRVKFWPRHPPFQFRPFHLWTICRAARRTAVCAWEAQGRVRGAQASQMVFTKSQFDHRQNLSDGYNPIHLSGFSIFTLHCASSPES
eukprot:1160778-Pelagomonas_calceolata.AAC.3